MVMNSGQKSKVYLLLGIILSLSGGIFIILYLFSAVIENAENPDKSIIFWYLPVLFIVTPSLVAGVLLIVRSQNKK